MTGTGQTVAAHTAVVFFFVSSLSATAQTDDHVARTDVRIVDHIAAFHTAGHGRVNDNGAHQVAYVGSFTAGCVDAYTHFSHFGQQLVGAVDDGADYFARNQHLVSSDGRGYQNVVYGTHTQQVVGVHDQGILCNAFPNRKVAGFFPIHVSQ